MLYRPHRQELHPSEIGAKVQYSLTRTYAAVAVQTHYVAADRLILNPFFGCDHKLVVLLVVDKQALRIDIFRTVDGVLGPCERSEDPARLGVGGDGRHHAAVLHVLGCGVDGDDNILWVNLTLVADGRILHGVAGLDGTHTALEFQKLPFGIERHLAMIPEMGVQGEVGLRRNLAAPAGQTVVRRPDGIQINLVLHIILIHIVVVADGIVPAARGDMRGHIEYLMILSLRIGKNPSLL